jgi:hypothetical protein
MSDPERLSTFALDVYWASGRPDPAIDRHLQGCEPCRAYIARLYAMAREPPPRVPVAMARRPAVLRHSAPWVAGALAGAAVVLILVRGAHRSEAPEGYVGVKGTPAVQVLVQGDGRTSIWDGQSPVRAGNALGLRVACEGLGRVTIATRGIDDRGWTRLVDADCPRDTSPLPFTLVVDDKPGDEHIAVVMSRDRLDDTALNAAARDTARSRDVWVVRIVLPKLTPDLR